MIGPEPSLERLLDWWCGELSSDDADALDELLFTDASWAEAAERLIGAAERIAAASKAGAFSFALTPALLERLQADGVSLRHYFLSPGEVVPCSATPDDYSVVHLRGDVGGVERVDVEIVSGGDPPYVLRDVPVDWSRGEVAIARSGAFVRRLSDRRIRLTLRGFQAGREHLVGEYVLDHVAARPA